MAQVAIHAIGPEGTAILGLPARSALNGEHPQTTITARAAAPTGYKGYCATIVIQIVQQFSSAKHLSYCKILFYF